MRLKHSLFRACATPVEVFICAIRLTFTLPTGFCPEVIPENPRPNFPAPGTFNYEN
jgi:hypothetical protein